MTDSERQFPKIGLARTRREQWGNFSNTSTNYKTWFTEIFRPASQTELTSSLTTLERNAISSESLSMTSGNRYPLKSFPGKKCLSCLKDKGANVYIRKIQKPREGMEEPLEKRVSLIGKEDAKAKVSHGGQSYRSVR
jgi:hypothetical protein